MSELFPVFLKLQGRRAVVIGAGGIGLRRVEGLLRAGAKVRVVSLEVSPAAQVLADSGEIDLKRRAYRDGDLADAFLAVAATGDHEVNTAIMREAERTGCLFNAVDDPTNCNFYLGAVHRAGDLQVVIGTQGRAPILARLLRERMGRWIPTELGGVLEEVAARREQLAQQRPDDLAGRTEELRAFAEEALRRIGL